jgi:hypothetical protein
MEPTEQTRAIVLGYHAAWTGKDFAAASAFLSPGLAVEVPVHEYPTRESFSRALAGFGSRARGVRLLSEFAQQDEAMLLYDLDVEGLGRFRVAEHFTVKDGQITRIRQIHDTDGIRKAGWVK